MKFLKLLQICDIFNCILLCLLGSYSNAIILSLRLLLTMRLNMNPEVRKSKNLAEFKIKYEDLKSINHYDN